MFMYLFCSQCTCQYMSVAVCISKQDCLEDSNQLQGTYIGGQCILVQAGLLPGLPCTEHARLWLLRMNQNKNNDT